MGKFNNFITNLKVAIDYLKSDLIKNQRSFKIGFISIFLVVFFLTLIFNGIQLSSCIFIKLSEKQNGEIDLILTPYLTNNNIESKKSNFDTNFYKKKTITYTNTSDNNFTNLNFLNLYEIKEKLANLSFIEGISPRWFILGKASHKDEEKNITNEFSTNIIVLDSSTENDIGIGRALNLPELQINECYISNTLSKALKVNTNDVIKMEIKLSDLIKTFLFGNMAKGEENDIFDVYEDESDDNYEDNKQKNKPIKINGFKGDLRDDYENEENMDNDTIIKNSKNNINLGFNLFDNNKIKDIKNKIVYSEPVKNMLKTIINEYIKDNVINNFNKTLDFINENLLPANIKVDDLLSLQFRKAYLYDPLVKDMVYIQLLRNILFPDNNTLNEEKSKNKNMVNKIVHSLIKKLFIYNNETDLIRFDKDILTYISEGNFTNYLEENINYTEFLEEDFIFENMTNFLNIKLNLTVRSKISSSLGKWPSSLGYVLAIDSRHIKDYLYLNAKNILNDIMNSLNIETMENIIWKSIDNNLKDFDINKYCLTINGIFKNKFEIYKKDQKSMRHYLSEISEEITTLLGFNCQVNIQTPLYEVMEGFSVIKIFLEDIFVGIMFFIWMLSVLLVYSLMLGNVDERTYEFGMMRSLGLKKNNLIYLIVLKGLFFALPGIILGLTTSYIANNFIAFLFNLYSGLVMPFFLSKINFIFGTLAGLSIPLISSYLPIKKALENNLRDTLTIFNNKKLGDTVVSMIKLEKMGISPSVLTASITLIIIGLLTYYLCPLSYFLNNFSLFLFIMICILITMLLGLIILSQLIVPFLQNIILKIIMFISFKDRKFYLIVIKNLDGHKRRNRQVSIMFIIALGFIIFAGCSLNLIVDFVEQFAKGLIAGDFSVYVLNKNNQNVTLNEISINNYLQNITKNYPDLIKNYSYYSWSLDDLLSVNNFSLITKFGSLNGYPLMDKKIYGIGRSYIDSSHNSLYSLSDYDTNLNISYTDKNKVDIIKMLYENQNIPNLLEEKKKSFIYPINKNKNKIPNYQLNLLVADGIKKNFGINIENPARLSIVPSSENIPENNIPCRIIGMAQKLPGLMDYSSYKSFSMYSALYISLEQMKKLIELESEIYNINIGNLSNTTFDSIRKLRFILKYKDNVNKELKEMVYFGMNNYLEGLSTYSIQLDEIIDIVYKVKYVIEYIFLVLGIIALILSFFLIWTSFYSNIRDNIAEYGIMRSIGVSKAQSVRIYLYEACTIIITSIIIGTFLGIIISSSLILQFDIFFELPFIFNFPFKLYIILISFGLFLGLLGSYYPTYAVNSLSLVKIMKGFNE